jgi:hypothetical protein
VIEKLCAQISAVTRTARLSYPVHDDELHHDYEGAVTEMRPEDGPRATSSLDIAGL